MKQFLSLLVLFLILLVILMPPTVKIGKTNFYRPLINFSLLGKKVARDLDVKFGLDLAGGVHLVYQADTSKIPGSDQDTAIAAAKSNIERRINLLGVSEPVIQTSKVGDTYRINVEIAGVKNVNEAVQTIGQTALLEFRETTAATPSSAVDFKPTGLTGADLRTSQVQFGSGNNASSEPTVGIEFTPEGAKKFTEITSRNIGRPLAIFLDDQMVMAPVVQTAITDGRANISGKFTVEDAKRLTIQLNAGSLPVPVKIVEQRQVGASLGKESIVKSLVAGIVGLILIFIFMLVNYGVRGIIADIALIFYVMISLSLVKLIPITLTLAGIAGFILSIGMAVDANILIFERIKEELRWGRPLKAAVELGFHRAWNSIRDSNASSLITASILFWFGSGSVRGFALTLAMGILVSLFTSINITRVLLKTVYRT